MLLKQFLIPTYVQMLGALSAWLGKAGADGDGEAALLTARLAPDMYPLSTQIRFTCVQAYEGIARMRQETLPPVAARLLNEGRNAAEHPGTIADAQDRIAATIAAVQAAGIGDPAIDPSTPIAHDIPQGMTFDLTAEQYVRDWALPQFYFHIMAAYAILRAQGVPLGKVDYVTHMFAYLRPGTGGA